MECWKDIDGYDGNYKISDHGRVMSYKQKIPRIMKMQDDGHGYQRLRLRKNGNYHYCYIHRLVADAFVPNKSGYNVVNHKDENPKNNHFTNLEWCDNQYNLNYGTSRYRAIKNTMKQVVQYDSKHNFIQKWDSIIQASETLKIDNSSITKNCKKRVKSAGGFIWEYTKTTSGVC